MLWAVLALAWIGAGCGHTVGQHQPGVDNFDTVDPAPQAIYRGAQPDLNVGLKTLRDTYQVRTIINLRDDPVAGERQAVEALGMKYIAIPTSCMHVKPEQLMEFLSDVRASPRPIFVHCQVGKDRTGLNVAVYRIVIEGWDRQRAMEELHRHGHNGFNRLFCGAVDHYLATFNPDDLHGSHFP